MKMLNFKVVYRPFPESDVHSEMIIPALDEQDAKRLFEQQFRGMVVEIQETL
jgi:hypothetical protein